MASWDQTESPHFSARHDEVDAEDAERVLEQLEDVREDLVGLFPSVPDVVNVVLHDSRGQLYTAQPALLGVVSLTAPSARRYVVGWPTAGGLHVLAPRHARSRASNVPGSREMALRAPAALYAQIVVAHNNPVLPPPFRPAAVRQMLRWAWLWAGAGQYLGGQTPYARPAITRRLREGGEPAFPPSPRDAMLLGGTVLDLLATEHGPEAVADLLCTLPPGSPASALQRAFGASLVHVGGMWRAHLAHLAARQ